MKEKDKKKRKFKEYDLFFMQFGFKEDKRIRRTLELTLEERWDIYIKENKKRLKQ